ncbi:MAG: DNA polymerase III subunit delta [Microscillaceae bacterium]|nr:DNA polymerase III subunit delta [Microscillaceae bacterium]
MRFEKIPGQEVLKARLCQRIADGRIPHAQLFVGPEGSAALSLARAYAQYVQCTQRQAQDACGQCASCHKHLKLIHPDLHFVFPVTTTEKIKSKPSSQDFMGEWRQFLHQYPYGNLSDWLASIGADNKNGLIPIEESRQILQKLSLTSYESRYKILLIWLPETMNIASANALLKILEEPPPFTLFLLASQDEKQLLSTIQSRVQILRITSFLPEEIQQYLQNQATCSLPQAEEIAHLAEGNLREALRLAQETEEGSFAIFRDWLRLIYTQNLSELVQTADQLGSLRKDLQKQFLHYGLRTFRELLLVLGGGETLLRVGESQRNFVEGLAKVVKPGVLENLYTLFNEALFHLERNANAKILFLDLGLRLIPLLKA